MIIELTRMQQGETGLVKEIQGGHGMIRRLQRLGVRAGKKITKVSSHFWRGPQTIEVDNMQIAIGHGIARRIFVEIEECK
jgi:ferrous iron transport protein A